MFTMTKTRSHGLMLDPFRRMRARLAIVMVVSLSIGSLLSLAFAVASVCLCQQRRGPDIYYPDIHARKTWVAYGGETDDCQFSGYEVRYIGWSMIDIAAGDDASDGFRNARGAITIVRAGWPFPCLQAISMQWKHEHRQWGWTRPASMWPLPDPYVLPTSPMFVGLLADVGIVAFGVFVILANWLFARPLLRLFAGKCAACGYDLRVQYAGVQTARIIRCPECGWGREK